MGFKKSPAYKYINFGLSFGLTMAITVYLLYQGGKWLDTRLNSAPWFMLLGIVLAIAAVFKRLFAEIKMLERELSQNENEETPTE
ncbi:MAG: AtpZ/AtpI family protein [Clostridia bacterium]|jgi:F0F1-type ATP synthase assembly protein I|nr:AtpZ/AtpI family protein [Clostridia bacterium]